MGGRHHPDEVFKLIRDRQLGEDGRVEPHGSAEILFCGFNDVSGFPCLEAGQGRGPQAQFVLHEPLPGGPRIAGEGE